ncbi:MAG: head-tail joining protein [Myxococcota bacterium]
MPSARGSIHTTTGGSIALLAASSWTVLGAATIGALVTAGDQLADFDSPVAGRLRYIGSETRTFAVRGRATLTAPGSTPIQYRYRLAKNGTTIEASEQRRQQWSFQGSQGVEVEALVTLSMGDYLEVHAEATQNGTLDVEELSLVAAPAELSASEIPPGVGGNWLAMEALLGQAMVSGPLTEPITVTPAGEAGVDVPGIYSVNELVIEGEVRIQTHSPHVGFRLSDLPTAPVPGMEIRARGIDYVIPDGGVIPYGGGEWVELMLHAVA